MRNRNELRCLKNKMARQSIEVTVTAAELRHFAEMKSTLISIAAHEFRSPLTAILGYLEMLMDEDMGPLNPEQADALTVIQQGAYRLLEIANNFLDVTRIETGQVNLALTPVSLSELVEQVIWELKPQLQKKNQHLALRMDSPLPPALADRRRAAQIIGNLVNNASKYTLPGGTIIVCLTLADKEGFLQFSVADTGIGIAPHEQPHLFDSFFRAGNASQTDATGLGLSLHITRSLVEMHGGRIWFQSELNKGSTFYVTFPLAEPFPSA